MLSNYDVTLSNVTLIGNVEGLRLTNGVGLIENSTITASQANGIQGNGELTIVQSTISNNRASGIYTDENLMMTNSTVSQNGYAGLYISSLTTTVLNSTVTGLGDFGIVIINGGSLILQNSIASGSGIGDCTIFSGTGRC